MVNNCRPRIPYNLVSRTGPIKLKDASTESEVGLNSYFRVYAWPLDAGCADGDAIASFAWVHLHLPSLSSFIPRASTRKLGHPVAKLGRGVDSATMTSN